MTRYPRESFETWLEEAYPFVKRNGASSVRLSPANFDTANWILGLNEKAIESCLDLETTRTITENDDAGVNYLVTLPNGSRLVFKRIRNERVREPFHEPYIGYLISSLGMHTLEYIGVLTHESSQWLISRYVSDHLSLEEFLLDSTKSAGLRDGLLFDAGYLAGHLLTLELAYDGFDFKNLLIHESGTGPLIIHDFERADALPLSIEEVIQQGTPGLLRRRARNQLSEYDVQQFLSGVLSLVVLLDVNKLSDLVSRIAAPNGDSVSLISIDGIAGSGKSTLANDLAERLGSAVIETDYFVRFNREERSAPGFSVPHPDWYDRESYSRKLTEVRERGKTSLIEAYSHDTGRHTHDEQVIATPLTIVEGMYAGLATVNATFNMSIGLTAPAKKARTRFLDREHERSVRDPRESILREMRINSIPAVQAISHSLLDVDLLLEAESRGVYRLVGGQARTVGRAIRMAKDVQTEAGSTSCPLCPQSISTGRFDSSHQFQALYNIAPIVQGHVLVAPLQHKLSLQDLDARTRAEFFEYAFTITERILRWTESEQYDWALQDGVDAGQSLGHVHLHIIPRKPQDMDRPGSWFTSLYGPSAAAPDSDERPRLSDDEMREAVRKLREE